MCKQRKTDPFFSRPPNDHQQLRLRTSRSSGCSRRTNGRDSIPVGGDPYTPCRSRSRRSVWRTGPVGSLRHRSVRSLETCSESRSRRVDAQKNVTDVCRVREDWRRGPDRVLRKTSERRRPQLRFATRCPSRAVNTNRTPTADSRCHRLTSAKTCVRFAVGSNDSIGCVYEFLFYFFFFRFFVASPVVFLFLTVFDSTARRPTA